MSLLVVLMIIFSQLNFKSCKTTNILVRQAKQNILKHLLTNMTETEFVIF